MSKKIKVEKFVQDLGLEIVLPGDKEKITINETEICRPGLQFSGYFNYFEYNRVQMVGLVEYMYMQEKTSEYKKEIFEKYFSYDIPCIILTRDLNPHQEFLDAAKKAGVPVFKSKEPTTQLKQKLLDYLVELLAKTIERHGVLMDIYGVGVMIIGDSGMGKSETALELVKRKHRLVADDVIKIKKLSHKKLKGASPLATRYLLEIRGIGIIDVSKMYGISSVIDDKKIDLVIELEMWDKNKEYERLGLNYETYNILDVELPYMLMPVRPGRNLAIVIEAAAKYYMLRQRGVNPAKELAERLSLFI